MFSWTHVAVLLGSLPLALCAVDPTQLQDHLTRGAGILGTYSSTGRLTNWMSTLEDSAPLQSLNLPGTHDSAAWNPPGITKGLLQCQDQPLFDQLNAGVRFFDIRFGNQNGTLGLYHGPALLDPNAQLEDVFWGFYHWLDDHPTETLIISLKVDSGETTAEVQSKVQGYTTSSPGSDYWITNPTLGTLGDARGKLVLFRRFTWTSGGTFGLDMTDWKDNTSFNTEYADGATAYIEDYYLLNLGGVPADTVVQTKMAAVIGNIDSARASGANSSQLFITFASGGGQIESQYVTPRVLALGSTSTNADSATKGVNALLLEYLQQHSGDRLGVVLVDFFNTPTDLVLAAIANSNVSPNATAGGTPSGSTTAGGPQSTTTTTPGDGVGIRAVVHTTVLLSSLIACFVSL